MINQGLWNHKVGYNVLTKSFLSQLEAIKKSNIVNINTRCLSRRLLSSEAITSSSYNQLIRSNHLRLTTQYRNTGRYNDYRLLSSSSTNQNNDEQQQKKKPDGEDDETTKEIVLTPGETVVAVSRLTMWAGVAVFAAVCAYYIIKELVPT